MQTMVDYKLRQDAVTPAILDITTALRRAYHERGFCTGDKLATNILLRGSPPHHLGNVLPLELTKGVLDDWRRHLDIPLLRRMGRVGSLHEALRKVTNIEPGGNASNEERCLIKLMEEGIGPETLRLYASLDPVSQAYHDALPAAVRERVTITKIDLPGRFALHLPYRKEGGKKLGTVAISVPATSTLDAIRPYFDELLHTHHVIVSEGLGRCILGTRLKVAKQLALAQKINPSSAFRSDCATDSYEYCRRGGAPPVATMNDDEFDSYLRAMKGRVQDEDPKNLPPYTFPSPFETGAAISGKAVNTVNKAFREYFQYIPPPSSDHVHFPLNVSCGGRGGFHVATIGDRRYVVFSATPHEGGVKQLLRLAGNPPGIGRNIQRAMGAGDALGALLSVANSTDLVQYLDALATETGRSGASQRYLHAAVVAFVSILSRILGAYLYHTEKCDFTDLPVNRLRGIFAEAGKEALVAAEHLWDATTKPKTAGTKWGIRVALWQL